MDELLNAILDAACDFFGIDPRRGRGPGLLRWIFHLLLKLFLLLFGILALMTSFLQFRKLRKYRWISVLLMILLIVVIAAIFVWLYLF